MSLENIYYISQTVAVVAILASLIAIFFQMRQTSKLARAELSQTAWSQGQQIQLSLFATNEDADFMNRAVFTPAPLTEAEKARFGVTMVTMVSLMEGMYFLKERDLIERAAYDRAVASMTIYFRSPRVRKWWNNVRQDFFLPPFDDVIDQIIARIEAQSPVNQPTEKTVTNTAEPVWSS